MAGRRCRYFDAARRYMGFRFPALKDAPLVESKICQYESTPDGDFIVDQHPKAAHVWIVGGGSGHGFKHGPAFGERVAETVLVPCIRTRLQYASPHDHCPNGKQRQVEGRTGHEFPPCGSGKDPFRQEGQEGRKD